MAAALAASSRSDTSAASDTPTLPIATRRAMRDAPTPPTREYPSPVAPEPMAEGPATAVAESSLVAGPAARLAVTRRVAMWLTVAVTLFVALFAVGYVAARQLSDTGQSSVEPPPATTTPTSKTIPGPLRHALDQLDQAVQP